jgi:hypothetical protein
MRPHELLEVLYALVVIASETTAVHDAIKESQGLREPLLATRAELRREVREAEQGRKAQEEQKKGAAASDKGKGSGTAAAKNGKAAGGAAQPKASAGMPVGGGTAAKDSTAKGADKGGSASAAKPAKGSKGGNPAGAAAAAGARAKDAALAELADAARAQDALRARLRDADAALATHDVRHAPHLGCDRQWNDFYAVDDGRGAGEGAAGPLLVLCHEYSWVRRRCWTSDAVHSAASHA